MKAFRTAALALAASAAIAAAVPATAGAQQIGPHGVPTYGRWQPGWDRGEVDRGHVMLGTVTGFSPFRLTLARQNGDVQTIDLKNGTIILPRGATPMTNERVAVVGYYSNGTFIANRVLIHP